MLSLRLHRVLGAALVVAALALPLLAQDTRPATEPGGQETRPAGSALLEWTTSALDERKLPRTAKEAEEQLLRVTKALEALKAQPQRPAPTEDGAAAPAAANGVTLEDQLVAQQSELASLKAALEQNNGLVPERLDEEKTRLAEQIARLEQERKQVEALIDTPVAIPDEPVTDQTFAEANAEKARLESARSAATQALELARNARAGRTEVLGAMTQELAKVRETLLQRRTELQGKRDLGETGEAVEVLTERVWKHQLKAHRLELLRTYQQAELDREILASRQQRAELEKNNLDRLLGRQERLVKALGERKKEQDDRRREREKREAARAEALPPGQARLVEMTEEARESLEDKQELQDWWVVHAGTGNASELAAAAAEARSIRERLDEDPEAPGAVTPSPAQIRSDLDATRRHVELARRLDAKLRADMRAARVTLDDASRNLVELDAIVAEAKAADVEAGNEVSEARYETLVGDLREALERQRAGMADLLKTLMTGNSEAIKSLRRDAAENEFDLQRRARWTQEERVISAEAVERAFEDGQDAVIQLSRRPGEVVGAVVRYFSDGANTARFVVAGILVLLALLIFRLIVKHLPKNFDWLEQQEKPSMRRAAKAFGLIVRRTALSFLLALVFVGVPWITGFPDRWVGILAIFLATPFFYRFGRVVLDVLFAPDYPEGGFLPFDESLSSYLHRIGRYLLNLSLVFVPIGYLMEVLAYDEVNPGFVRLWWMIYKLLANALILITIFRPMVLKRLIRGSSVVAASVKTWIFVGYPILVLAVLSLFLLNGLRYYEAERFFRLLFLQTAAVLLAAYVLYRVLLSTVLKGKDVNRQVVSDDFPDQESFIAAGRALFFDRCIRLGLRVLFILPVVFVLQGLWELVDFRFLDFALWGDGLTLRRIIAATIGIVITVAIVRVVKGFLNYVLAPSMELDVGLRYTISTLASYAVMTLAGIVILNLLNVTGEQIAIVTGALMFGIGFGLQSIVKNFISGLILLIERPVKVGDRVDVGTAGGLVDKITLRATTVMTWDGVGIVIPNEQLIGGTLTNHSLGFPRLRSSLRVGVAYGSDLQRVREVCSEIVKKHGLILKRPEPEVLFQGFGDSSLDFEVRFWTLLDANRPRIQSDLRYALDAAFRKNGIEIPFPQRDVNLRIRNGEVALPIDATYRRARAIEASPPEVAEAEGGESAPAEGKDGGDAKA